MNNMNKKASKDFPTPNPPPTDPWGYRVTFSNLGVDARPAKKPDDTFIVGLPGPGRSRMEVLPPDISGRKK